MTWCRVCLGTVALLSLRHWSSGLAHSWTDYNHSLANQMSITGKFSQFRLGSDGHVWGESVNTSVAFAQLFTHLWYTWETTAVFAEFTIQIKGKFYSSLEQIFEDNPLIFSSLVHLQVWLPCGERSSPALWNSKRQAVFRLTLVSCTLLDFSGRRLVIRCTHLCTTLLLFCCQNHWISTLFLH